MGARIGKHTYGGGAATVNGAEIRLRVKPEGTAGGSYVMSAMVAGVAVATLDGPFRWRIEGTGVHGRQESMVVRRLKTRTEKTKREEWYPASHLGRKVEFLRLKGDRGAVRAVYEIPGLLKVKPKEDGALEVLADVTVTASGKSERKLVRFRLDPAEKRQDEFIFLPAEIVRSVRDGPEAADAGSWD